MTGELEILETTRRVPTSPKKIAKFSNVRAQRDISTDRMKMGVRAEIQGEELAGYHPPRSYRESINFQISKIFEYP